MCCDIVHTAHPHSRGHSGLAEGVPAGNVLRRFLWALIAPAVMAGCGSSNPATPSDAATAVSGTATVMLQDSPFTDAKAVLVTFSEVSIHKSGGDFVTLPFVSGGNNRTCDLRKLVGAAAVPNRSHMKAGSRRASIARRPRQRIGDEETKRHREVTFHRRAPLLQSAYVRPICGSALAVAAGTH